MEPTRPAPANRVYDGFQELARRLISRPLGGSFAQGAKMDTGHLDLQYRLFMVGDRSFSLWDLDISAQVLEAISKPFLG
jgi:hypothetical protein